VIKKGITFALMLLLIGFIAACGIDPWVRNEVPTDHITITKVTKFTGLKGDQIKGKVDLKKLGLKESPLIKATVGAVKMSHKTHIDSGMKCIDCHHKTNNDARIKQCAVCHRGNNGFEVLHGKCLDCHIKVKNGIEKCKQCH